MKRAPPIDPVPLDSEACLTLVRARRECSGGPVLEIGYVLQ
jgi:hypothetical protein